MSDEYYAAMREAIFWQSMSQAIPLAIFAGILAGLMCWMGLQKKSNNETTCSREKS